MGSAGQLTGAPHLCQQPLTATVPATASPPVPRSTQRTPGTGETLTLLVLQRYLTRITPSDRQIKGHLAAKLSDCTPASRSLARPQETSNVVVLVRGETPRDFRALTTFHRPCTGPFRLLRFHLARCILSEKRLGYVSGHIASYVVLAPLAHNSCASKNTYSGSRLLHI